MEIRIMDKRTGRTWVEKFNTPYLLEKRVNKLKHSKNLKVIATWN
jgi:hypothetical protein